MNHGQNGGITPPATTPKKEVSGNMTRVKQVKEGIDPVYQGVQTDGPAVPGKTLEKPKLYIETNGGSYGPGDYFEYLFVLKGFLTEEQANFFFDLDSELLNTILEPIFDVILKTPQSVKDALNNEDPEFSIKGALIRFFEDLAFARITELIPKNSPYYEVLTQLSIIDQIRHSLLRLLVKEFIPDFMSLL